MAFDWKGAGAVGALGGSMLAPLGGMFGGLFGGQGGQPQMYQPQYMGQMDASQWANYQAAQQAIQQNLAQTPQYAQQAFGTLWNNPYAQQMIGGAAGAGQLMQGQGLQDIGAAQNLYGGAGQIMQTGFDPQQALYQQQLQKLQEQTRASQYARGITESPYGAGLESQATGQFNIDWQNAQLARQQAALGAAGGAYGQGAQLGYGGAQAYGAGAAMPYQAQQQMGMGQLGAIQALGQGMQPYLGALQGQQQMAQGYLGTGLGAQAQQLQQYQQNQQQRMQEMGMLFQGLGAAGGMAAGMGAGGGGMGGGGGGYYGGSPMTYQSPFTPNYQSFTPGYGI